MRSLRSLRPTHDVATLVPSAALALAALAALPAGARAQDPAPPAPDSAQADSAPAAPFACEEQGLRGGAAFGCQLLARPTVTRFPAGPLFWHLARFASREEAQAAARFTDVVTEVATDAGGETWLHRFGVEADVPRGGSRAALVGPLPLPRASAYRIDVLHVVMPAGARTAARTHPGPAAWYLLEGEQCVEARRGEAVLRAAAGEGIVAPPAGTPMQVANPGAGTQRALMLVIRDPGRPREAPSRWKPTGACDAPAGG